MSDTTGLSSVEIQHLLDDLNIDMPTRELLAEALRVTLQLEAEEER